MKTHHHPNRALSQKELEVRRLRAVPYFKTGRSLRHIARKLGVSPIAVHQWRVSWRDKGRAGLKAGRYGSVSKLSPQKERMVQKRLLKGAEIHGFSGDFWTLGRMTKAIAAWTGSTYRARSVWHLMRRLGFSCQKPAKRAVERDERAIRTWLTDIWPKVKKGA